MEKDSKNVSVAQKLAGDAKALLASEKNITDVVQNRVISLTKEGRITLPKDYAVGNAMTSAWLILQSTVDKDKKSVLSVCTPDSIINALLDMAILGLNPAKQQGYFIAYGNQLSWFTSYFGYIAVVSRLKNIMDLPIANLIYEGDTIEMGKNDSGEIAIIDHATKWENIEKGKLVGVYAEITVDGKERQAYLPMREILESWNMSKTNKEHKQFTGEFAKRTAYNRLLKMLLKTSTDDDLLSETLIKTEEDHFEFLKDNVVLDVKKDVIEQTGKDIPKFQDPTAGKADKIIEESSEPSKGETPVTKVEEPVTEGEQQALDLENRAAGF